MVEQWEVVGADDLIDIPLPKIHRRFSPALGAQFGGFEKDDNETVEGIDLILAQLVLGNEDVLFADLVSFPREQAKV